MTGRHCAIGLRAMVLCLVVGAFALLLVACAGDGLPPGTIEEDFATAEADREANLDSDRPQAFPGNEELDEEADVEPTRRGILTRPSSRTEATDSENTGETGGDRGGDGSAVEAKFTSVSARGSHTCGVKTDGSVACWGLGSVIRQ